MATYMPLAATSGALALSSAALNYAGAKFSPQAVKDLANKTLGAATPYVGYTISAAVPIAIAVVFNFLPFSPLKNVGAVAALAALLFAIDTGSALCCQDGISKGTGRRRRRALSQEGIDGGGGGGGGGASRSRSSSPVPATSGLGAAAAGGGAGGGGGGDTSVVL